MERSIILVCREGEGRWFWRSTPNTDGSFGGIFDGDEPISFAVSSLGTGETLAYGDGPGNLWVAAARTEWLIDIPGDASERIGPGLFKLDVWATHPDGRISVLFDGRLRIRATADSHSLKTT
jgi:hypothetical protein